MPLLSTIGAAAARAFGFLRSLISGYNVANSLRFNAGSSDYLNKTFGTATNRKIFTISVWTKRSKLGDPGVGATGMTMFSGGIANSAQTSLEFTNTNVFSFMDIASPYSAYNFIVRSSETNLVIRDLSAWYHLVVAYDSTQATDSNRIKLYLNGSQVTSFSATGYPTLNYEPYMNNNIVHRIGNTMDNTFGDRYYNGYLSEFNFIDGQALTPSSFGETDTLTGIWKPKAYAGTYGNNGFYQKYANSAALGTDSSGNGNNFTVNNLTSVDQSTDTSTNNFATINTLTCNDTGTLTAGDGNLTISGGNDMGATINISKGKWYWESKRNTGAVAHWGIGFTQSWNSSTQIVTGNGSGIFIRNDFVGGYNVNNSGSNGFTSISGSTTGSNIANGDIVGIALDLDSATKSITFYQNGSSVGSGTFSYDGTTTFCTPFIRNNSGAQSQWNFGSPPYAANSYADAAGFGNFSYAVPSGYYALCTKNLATYG